MKQYTVLVMSFPIGGAAGRASSLCSRVYICERLTKTGSLDAGSAIGPVHRKVQGTREHIRYTRAHCNIRPTDIDWKAVSHVWLQARLYLL